MGYILGEAPQEHEGYKYNPVTKKYEKVSSTEKFFENLGFDFIKSTYLTGKDIGTKALYKELGMREPEIPPFGASGDESGDEKPKKNLTPYYIGGGVLGVLALILIAKNRTQKKRQVQI